MNICHDEHLIHVYINQLPPINILVFSLSLASSGACILVAFLFTRNPLNGAEFQTYISAVNNLYLNFVLSSEMSSLKIFDVARRNRRAWWLQGRLLKHGTQHSGNDPSMRKVKRGQFSGAWRK